LVNGHSSSLEVFLRFTAEKHFAMLKHMAPSLLANSISFYPRISSKFTHFPFVVWEALPDSIYKFRARGFNISFQEELRSMSSEAPGIHFRHSDK
jgi:hypothetical protein